jgi:hypothetical protein
MCNARTVRAAKRRISRHRPRYGLCETANDSVRADHHFQLFDSDGSLAAAVATFAQDGLADGDTVLVVTSAERWKRVVNQLANRGVAVAMHLESRRLLYRDAGELLDQFMQANGPNPGLFDASVGRVVCGLTARATRLRIYGDMVDLLSGTGDFASAHRLETLWDELLAGLAVELLCGYSAAHFASAHQADALRIMCRCHTAIRSSRDDTLSTHLLEAVGAAARA